MSEKREDIEARIHEREQRVRSTVAIEVDGKSTGPMSLDAFIALNKAAAKKKPRKRRT